MLDELKSLFLSEEYKLMNIWLCFHKFEIKIFQIT